MDALSVAIISLLLVVILFAMWKADLGGLIRKSFILPIRIVGTIIVLLITVYLFLNLKNILAESWVLISLYVGLLGITSLYAIATTRQATANIEMAIEMREQRITTSRPIILQEAIPFRGDNLYDYFKIYNVGNGPAIELEIVLLGKDKQLLAREKKTVFMINTETKLDIKAVGLSNHFDSLCQLLYQYRSIESSKLWYKTILPFIPRESKRNGIIIVPQELEFYESPEKELFNN